MCCLLTVISSCIFGKCCSPCDDSPNVIDKTVLKVSEQVDRLKGIPDEYLRKKQDEKSSKQIAASRVTRDEIAEEYSQYTRLNNVVNEGFYKP